MANQVPSFEQEDQQGTLTMHSATVDTSAINLPTTATTDLISASIYLPDDSVPHTKRLLYSFDGGTTFFTLSPGDSVIQPLRGGIKQIQIKGNVASVEYEVTIEKELR